MVRNTSSVAIACAKPRPRSPSKADGGEAHVGEFERGERVRGDHPNALAVVEAGRVGVDDEGGDALRAGRLAGAGEQDVEIGDAAVGDVGLGAVDDDSRSRSAAALVSIEATSEPEVGSVSAKAAIFSPAATAGR